MSQVVIQLSRKVSYTCSFMYQGILYICFSSIISLVSPNSYCTEITYVISSFTLPKDSVNILGHDGLNAKFLKLCGSHIAKPYCDLFNQCVNQSMFPTNMKLAEISPMFKKNDNLDKENYRSVNILMAMSKVFEYIISDQIISFFCDILNPALSAYRKGYSCQHVILQLTEYWREALDININWLMTMSVKWRWICPKPSTACRTACL